MASASPAAPTLGFVQFWWFPPQTKKQLGIT